MTEWILIVFFTYPNHIPPIQVGPFATKTACQVEGTAMLIENDEKPQKWSDQFPSRISYTRCVEVNK